MENLKGGSSKMTFGELNSLQLVDEHHRNFDGEFIFNYLKTLIS